VRLPSPVRGAPVLLALVLLMLGSGFGARPVSATAAPELAAPIPTAPADGAFFDRTPRTTTLGWRSVQGAVRYHLEIEHCAPQPTNTDGEVTTGAMCSQYCDVYGERGDCGYVADSTADATATEYTFEFGGAYPGRWRVFAIDAAGQPGSPSAWSEFAYTDGGVNPGYVRPAQGAVRVSLRSAGISFRAPRSWDRRRGRSPAVYVVKSGAAFVAVWRYRISADEESPTTHAALVDAKRALLKDVRRKDHSFQLVKADLLRVSGHPTVQILGVGRVAGHRRLIRSTHIYTRHAEYVVDAAAPPLVFDRVDRQVVAPLLRSLTIFGPK
jgi:hypothetical protein